MQYDENAEKYGYEGEMTPIECDELNAYKGDVTIPVYGTIADADVYLKKEADAVITELKADVNNALIQNQELCQALQVMYSAEEYMELQGENAELKAKLENVQASMYADVVDANMEVRRLRRALWLKRADDAKHLVTAYENYDYLDCQRMTIKQETARTWMTCKLRTAEEWVKVWKNIERKCRAMAEEYK